jgi:L-fuculose-phosphate aldolase
MNIDAIKKEIIEYSKLSYERNLVFSAGGNISCKKDGRFFITASGRSLRNLTKDDVLEINENGSVVGESHGLKPSKEAHLHLCVYRLKPEVKSVIHVHPINIVAFTVAGWTFPLNTAASGQKIRETTFAQFALPGSQDLVLNVEKAIKLASDNVQLVIMERHGILSYGEDLYSCFNLAELLEETAKVSFEADILRDAKQRRLI